MQKLRLGYACVNLTLAAEGVIGNKTIIKRTFEQKGIAYASEVALQNVQALKKMLDWNVAKGIQVFRVTSDLFPWASEYQLEELPNFEAIKSILVECGKMPQRLSAHPGPFNKLAGTGAALANTLRDLEIHAQMFDLMGLAPSHLNKINIHVGGAYGDKQATLERFAENYSELPDHIRKRLTVENDDKPGLFSIKELLPLHRMCGIPLVFDYFHHQLHPGGFSEEEAFHAAHETWSITPVFHFSSSRKDFEEPGAKKEAHADWLYRRIDNYGKQLDVMLEAKMKELALIRYQEEYGR